MFQKRVLKKIWRNFFLAKISFSAKIYAETKNCRKKLFTEKKNFALFFFMAKFFSKVFLDEIFFCDEKSCFYENIFWAKILFGKMYFGAFPPLTPRIILFLWVEPLC